MNAFMSIHIGPIIEEATTEAALIGLLPRMNPLVLLQVAQHPELFTTMQALIGAATSSPTTTTATITFSSRGCLHYYHSCWCRRHYRCRRGGGSSDRGSGDGDNDAVSGRCCGDGRRGGQGFSGSCSGSGREEIEWGIVRGSKIPSHSGSGGRSGEDGGRLIGAQSGQTCHRVRLHIDTFDASSSLR